MSIAKYKLIKKKPLTVLRTLPGSLVYGRWVEGEATEFTIQGHYYPLAAEEKKMLPESFRSTSTYKLHSTTELYSVREKQSQSPDKVKIGEYLYEVQEADHYSMGIRDHWEFLLVREEQSAGGTT